MERRLSGDACVEALIRAGFRIRSRGQSIAILARGSCIVMVPDVEVIDEEMLRAILRSAGVLPGELELHLAHHPTRSGFFAKHRGLDAKDPAAVPPTKQEPPSSRRRHG